MMNEKTIGVLVVLVLGALFVPAVLREVGDGERLGVVTYTRKTSFPCKLTLVWMRQYYTDGIMNEDAFVRIYYGWHDFEMGELYKINYHKEWTQIYKRVVSTEVIEID